MAKVIIYSKESCPYCVMAKNLLIHKGVTQIEEIRIDLDLGQKEQMIKLSGRMTVPQIFIDSIHVGGFDDLAKLNRGGELDELLKS